MSRSFEEIWLANGGVGGIGRAELFHGLEQGVRFVDVAGVELEVHLRGFYRRFCRFCLSLSRGGRLVCFRIVGHKIFLG